MSTRKLPWDWHPGTIPENVVAADEAYIETSYSFLLFRSELPGAVEIERGASVYVAAMLDVGLRGKVRLGEFSMLHGLIICDKEIIIGSHCLISYDVVLMDTYRMPIEAAARRAELRRIPTRHPRQVENEVTAYPIHIARNVWIGFGACILPGVNIGEGAIIGARSVVAEDVPPYTVVGGNPARIIRQLEINNEL